MKYPIEVIDGRQYTLCASCNTIKPFSDFWVSKKGHNKGIILRPCKTCSKARARKWRDRFSERVSETLRQYRLKNKTRINLTKKIWSQKNFKRVKLFRKAQKQVQLAIRRGDLIRPKTCEECGRDGSAIEAAHYNYTDFLKVRWLCRNCHRKWDHEKPKSLQPL